MAASAEPDARNARQRRAARARLRARPAPRPRAGRRGAPGRQHGTPLSVGRVRVRPAEGVGGFLRPKDVNVARLPGCRHSRSSASVRRSSWSSASEVSPVGMSDFRTSGSWGRGARVTTKSLQRAAAGRGEKKVRGGRLHGRARAPTGGRADRADVRLALAASSSAVGLPARLDPAIRGVDRARAGPPESALLPSCRQHERLQASCVHLRHTFASEALAAGISIFELSRVMGASVREIDRTYGHLVRDAEDTIRARLNARADQSGVYLASGGGGETDG